MDLKALTNNEHTILHQQMVGDDLIVIKENTKYRWLEYGGASTQSLMKRTTPEQLLTPVFQSLLFFFLLKKGPLKILTLGLGGASIERALAKMPDLALTSVDASQVMIELAQRYFYLPSDVKVVCQKAEEFVVQATEHYDVVLCDLFIGEKSPECLFTATFYSQLQRITSINAVVMINLQASTEDQLMKALLAIKKYFAFVVLFEFDDYANIVIAASSQEIPAKPELQQRLMMTPQLFSIGLDKVFEKMHYVFESKADNTVTPRS